MTKKIEVTIETNEVWVIYRPQGFSQGRQKTTKRCPVCETWGEFLTPEEAATLTGKSLRHIFRQIETAQLHFLETPAGGILICPSSLLTDHFVESESESLSAEVAISVLPPMPN